jgi:DNA-binding SARP family transcriptional activator
MVQLYMNQGASGAAIGACQKMLQHDECNESAHRLLMECYLRLGQRYLAVKQFRICETALKKLDLEPSEETLALHQRLTS